MTETDLALLVLAGPLAAALLLGCVPPLAPGGPPGGARLPGRHRRRACRGRPAGGRALGRPGGVRGARGQRRPRGAPHAPLARAGRPACRSRRRASTSTRSSASMAALVTLVAFLVQLYSLGYLAEETPPALGRYYLYQSLFAFAMLGLVFAPNFLQLFIFWELVGLCSYLLIGFYYQRPAAARAAVKAFWVTKLGDVGFLLGIVLLWGATGTFEFDTLFRAVAGGTLPVNLALYMGLIYLGAVGQERAVPAPRLAARRDGGPDAGVGADPRRHHGHGRRVPGGPGLPALPGGAVGHARDRLRRRVHRAPGGDARAGRVRHQARPRVLDRVPARLHDGRARARAPSRRASSTSCSTGSSRRSCSSRRGR